MTHEALSEEERQLSNKFYADMVERVKLLSEQIESDDKARRMLGSFLKQFLISYQKAFGDKPFMRVVNEVLQEINNRLEIEKTTGGPYDA